MFITFEGSEGSGKSTVIKYISLKLKKIKVPFVVFREPGSTEVGESLRKILLNSNTRKISIHTEALLCLAARSELVFEKIVPSLKKGKVVICDRFLDSTIAYQGYGLGVDIKWLKEISKNANFHIIPDLTILIDVPVRLGLKRSGARPDLSGGRQEKDRIEKRNTEYHNRVRQGYLAMAEKEPSRFFVVSGNQPIKNMAEKIWEKISNGF